MAQLQLGVEARVSLVHGRCKFDSFLEGLSIFSRRDGNVSVEGNLGTEDNREDFAITLKQRDPLQDQQGGNKFDKSFIDN